MGMTKNNSIFYLLILVVIFLYTAQAGIPEDSNIPDLKPSHISIFNDGNNTVTALEIPPIILGPGDMEVGMNETASIEWTIMEFDPDTYQVYLDNVIIEDPTPYNNSQRITVPVQTNTAGIFIYMIRATDMSGNNASNEVTVTVTDNNAPVITSPEDIEVDLNGTASIEWILTDSNPDTYQVYRGNVIIENSTSYNNNQRITVQVRTDTAGTFTYMIQATDESGNEASDEVSVTVIVTDNNAPVITNPGDMEVDLGETVNIEWTITEPDPDTYQVYRDDVRIVDTTSYTNNQKITFENQTDNVGTFTYMIQATDKSGNEASDEVTVTVTDDNAPVITHPDDMDVDLDETVSIEWTLTEPDPDTYQVYRDDVRIVDPTSYISTQKITIPVNTGEIGTFTYMIQATDKSGNEASDEVSVTVTDNNAPVITHPGDMDVGQNETVIIEWTLTEPDPDTYQVYRDDVRIVDPTLYTNNQKIPVEDQTDNVGNFTYMIQATDKSGNNASDEVLVIVKDKIPPVISSPGNMEVEQDSDMNIIWAITEQNPGMYCVLRNGDVEVPSIEYQCSDNITVPINTSCLGTYNYTISADDISNNIVSDQVNVTIKDTIKPIISTTSFNEIKIGLKENITWVINEKNPDKYRVEENGIEIVSPTAYQSGVDINVSKNSSKLGILQYKIYASDTSGNTASNQINITVTKEKTLRSTNKGGGGGGGTAGEDYKNIQFAKSEREIVSEGDNICYCFDTEGNCNIVMYINFTGLTNAGLIPAKVEMLYNTSSLVNYVPLDEVYKNVNMWLGNKGWANPKNIENATITFKVDKTWIDDNNILISNIIMNRYYEGHWHPLTTSLINCDDDYCYFTSQTHGFSCFAITTKREYIGNPGAEGISDKPKTDEEELSVNPPTDVNESGINTSTDQKQDSPGFSLSAGLLSLMICLASIIYCKKKQFL
jgi:PGF-pre-PGF domain-containing protein